MNNQKPKSIAAIKEPLFEIRVGLLKAVMLFVGDDGIRHFLQFVRFAWQDKTVRLTATNAKALAEAKASSDYLPPDAHGSFVIHSAYLGKLVNGLSDNQTVTFYTTDKDMTVAAMDVEDKLCSTFAFLPTEMPELFPNTDSVWIKPVSEHCDFNDKRIVLGVWVMERVVNAAKLLICSSPIVLWRNKGSPDTTNAQPIGCYIDGLQEEFVMLMMPDRQTEESLPLPSWPMDKFHTTLREKLTSKE